MWSLSPIQEILASRPWARLAEEKVPGRFGVHDPLDPDRRRRQAMRDFLIPEARAMTLRPLKPAGQPALRQGSDIAHFFDA